MRGWESPTRGVIRLFVLVLSALIALGGPVGCVARQQVAIEPQFVQSMDPARVNGGAALLVDALLIPADLPSERDARRRQLIDMKASDWFPPSGQGRVHGFAVATWEVKDGRIQLLEPIDSRVARIDGNRVVFEGFMADKSGAALLLLHANYLDGEQKPLIVRASPAGGDYVIIGVGESGLRFGTVGR